MPNLHLNPREQVKAVLCNTMNLLTNGHFFFNGSIAGRVEIIEQGLKAKSMEEIHAAILNLHQAQQHYKAPLLNFLTGQKHNQAPKVIHLLEEAYEKADMLVSQKGATKKDQILFMDIEDKYKEINDDYRKFFKTNPCPWLTNRSFEKNKVILDQVDMPYVNHDELHQIQEDMNTERYSHKLGPNFICFEHDTQINLVNSFLKKIRNGLEKGNEVIGWTLISKEKDVHLEYTTLSKHTQVS